MITSAILFTNGHVCYFDAKNEQVSMEYQGWFHIWAADLEAKGIDPAGLSHVDMMINGKHRKVKPFKSMNTWTYKIIE